MTIHENTSNPLTQRENARANIRISAYAESTSRAALIRDFTVCGLEDDKADRAYMISAVVAYRLRNSHKADEVELASELVNAEAVEHAANALAVLEAWAIVILDDKVKPGSKRVPTGKSHRTDFEQAAYNAAKSGLSFLKGTVKTAIAEGEQRAAEKAVGDAAFAELLANGETEPEKLMEARANAIAAFRKEQQEKAAKAAAEKQANKPKPEARPGSNEQATPSNVVQFPRGKVQNVGEVEAFCLKLADDVAAFQSANDAVITGDAGSVLRDLFAAIAKAKSELAKLHEAAEKEKEAAKLPRVRTTRGK